MPDNDLRQLLDAYATAAERKDLAAMLALYDENIRAFDTWGRWSYDNFDAWRGMNQEWLQSLGEMRDAVAFADVRTESEGDFGLVTAIVTYSALAPDGTTQRSMSSRLTWAARRRGGRWKIVHQHTSVPIDPNSAKAIFKR